MLAWQLVYWAFLALVQLQNNNLKTSNSDWNAYKVEFGKSYFNKQEDVLRSILFTFNKHKIDRFNCDQSSEAGYRLEINRFSDMTSYEIKQFKGYKPSFEAKNSAQAEQFLNKLLADVQEDQLPESVDWRKVAGRVTTVKDQGRCGSCWAFSAIGALEGQQVVRNTNLSEPIDLSAQNLIDCVKPPAAYGCSGGEISAAFNYTVDGIDDTQSYPYLGEDFQKCSFKKNKSVIRDLGAAYLLQNDESHLKQVVARYGPVSIGIDADSLEFLHYKGGIFDKPNCGKIMDHAVLVVGYGVDGKKGAYWIVKNSWGTRWGDEGYIYMSREKDNQCGIGHESVIPIL